MRIDLYRIQSGDDGTFGILKVGTETFYTVELPWRDNMANFSCVPADVYTLEVHSKTWALIGPTVSHWQEPDRARFCVLFDIANTPEELQGCIAVGEWFGYVGGRKGVVRSLKAFERLSAILNATDETHTLHITEGHPPNECEEEHP